MTLLVSSLRPSAILGTPSNKRLCRLSNSKGCWPPLGSDVQLTGIRFIVRDKTSRKMTGTCCLSANTNTIYSQSMFIPSPACRSAVTQSPTITITPESRWRSGNFMYAVAFFCSYSKLQILFWRSRSSRIGPWHDNKTTKDLKNYFLLRGRQTRS